MALFPKETTKPYRGLGDELPEDPPEDDFDDGDESISNEAAVDSSPGVSPSTTGGSLGEAPLPIYYRSIRDIVADLSKPVSPRHIRTRKQGGSVVSFIEWHVATRYLDFYSPGWFYEIRQMDVVRATDDSKVPDRLVMIVRIGIPAAEGIVWREATGSEPLNVEGWGDCSSNCEAMALKRAAAKFGLGRFLYDK